MNDRPQEPNRQYAQRQPAEGLLAARPGDHAFISDGAEQLLQIFRTGFERERVLEQLESVSGVIVADAETELHVLDLFAVYFAIRRHPAQIWQQHGAALYEQFLAHVLTWWCTEAKGSIVPLLDVGKYLSLRQGISTKRGVYDIFGQPHDVQYSDETPRVSVWTYFKVESRPSAWTFVPYVGLLAGGSSHESTKTYFFFDTEGHYTRTQTSRSSDYENNWAGLARTIARVNNDTKADRVAAEMAKLGKPFDKKLAKSIAAVR